jgi:hypothetical protein
MTLRAVFSVVTFSFLIAPPTVPMISLPLPDKRPVPRMMLIKQNAPAINLLPWSTPAPLYSLDSDPSQSENIHPVTAIFGSGSNPVAYMLANDTNIIGNSTDSEDSDVSHPIVPSPIVPSHSPNSVAPFHVPHIFWHCMATGPSTEFPVVLKALFDHGSHAVLISETFAMQLGLHHRRLPTPATIELAMQSDNKKVEVQLNEWVKIHFSDPSSLWLSKLVREIVAPSLCSPIVLGLPFLSHNNILIDHAMCTAIDKSCSFDLLNPVPPSPPSPQNETQRSLSSCEASAKVDGC